MYAMLRPGPGHFRGEAAPHLPHIRPTHTPAPSLSPSRAPERAATRPNREGDAKTCRRNVMMLITREWSCFVRESLN